MVISQCETREPTWSNGLTELLLGLAYNIVNPTGAAPLRWISFVFTIRTDSKKHGVCHTLLWGKNVNAGITGVIWRLPCRTKRTAKRKRDIRTNGGRWWNKDACAQVDFVKPDTWRLNHQLRGDWKSRFPYAEIHRKIILAHKNLTKVLWVRGWFAQSPTSNPIAVGF